MSKRKIIQINEEKCNGCSLCIPNCPEGAIQIIDGKARLISDIFCDGLGACIGYCPEGAITIEEREAEIYDEKKVMQNIIKAGRKTIIAHLKHLIDHNENNYLNQAMEALKEKGIEIDIQEISSNYIQTNSGCSGTKMVNYDDIEYNEQTDEISTRPFMLRQWPVQLHLVSPIAPYYREKDVLLAADCTAYAIGDFHKKFIKNTTIAIACPKLDTGLDKYIDKIKSLIDNAKINTLTVLTMEVPCCYGLLQISKQAQNLAERKIPIKYIKVSLKGKILSEEWI